MPYKSKNVHLNMQYSFPQEVAKVYYAVLWLCSGITTLLLEILVLINAHFPSCVYVINTYMEAEYKL